MKNISIYDNGGKSYDRITVIFNDRKRVTKDGVLYECIAASENGSGFYLHSEAMKGKHLGKKMDFSKLSLHLQNKLLIELNK